jgi:pimeloyl-ACP methyl ester carboxylesterase
MYFEHLRIPVGGGSAHIVRAGRGAHAVVFLHGLGTHSHLGRALLAPLAEAGWCAVAVDALGAGESDEVPEALETAARAEQLSRAIAALRLASVVLVGQDAGTLVALETAVREPERVRGCVLLSPPALDDFPGDDVRALQRASALQALNANSLFGARQALEPYLTALLSSPDALNASQLAAYLAPWVGAEGVAALIREASGVELSQASRERLRALRVPVLVVTGVLDTATSDWRRVLPRATVRQERVPGAKRLVPEESPHALLKLLTEFLGARPLLAAAPVDRGENADTRVGS